MTPELFAEYRAGPDAQGPYPSIKPGAVDPMVRQILENHKRYTEALDHESN